MTRTISQGTTRRGGITIFATVVASLVMFTEAAFGLAFTLTQIGGTAVNGRGVIGDTVTIAVDFTIDEDELMIGAFPTLWWDQEGGNVIDIVSSIEGGSTTLGGMTFNKINSNYLLFDGADVRTATVRSFPDGAPVSDSQVGTTYMLSTEDTTIAEHLSALKSEASRHTALTNLYTGRTARAIENRVRGV